MIQITKEINVEVTKPNIFQALVAKQYDMNTRFLKVTLMDCGTRIDVPNIETAKVVINAERKDGQSKGFDGVINDDGTVTVPLHSWMLELEGTVICDISVLDIVADDNKKLTTTSFTLIVEKAAYGGNDITSDPQYDVLVSLLEAAPTAQEALDKSNEALEISAEANSKYAACVEATENANNVLQDIKAGGYIESLKEMNNGSKFSVWIGTEEEYKTLQTKIPNCLYIFTDELSVGEAVEAALNERAKESIDFPGCFYREVDGEIEWINPPMIKGEIYPTTERHNGNKVHRLIMEQNFYPNEKILVCDHSSIVEATGFIVTQDTYLVERQKTIVFGEDLHLYGEWNMGDDPFVRWYIVNTTDEPINATVHFKITKGGN